MKHLLTDKFFLKLSLALIIGIISCEFLPIYLGLVIPIVTLFSIYLIQYIFKIQNRPWRSIALFSTMIFFGFGLHYYNFYFIKEKSEKQLEEVFNKKTTYLVRIEEKPEIRETSIKLKVTLLGVYANQIKYSFSQKMILYLDPTIQVDSMNYGDLYRVYGAINYPTPPLNPNEFDYKKWLTRNHIFATGYSNQIEYLKDNKSTLSAIKYIPLKARDFFEKRIEKYVKDKNSLDIAKSILIGVKTNIDPEIYDAYAATGTVHILSVSGIHFAIFFLLISKMIDFIIPKKYNVYGFFPKQFFSFFYALITGFNPPVFRSFLMLFFLDLQKTTKSPQSPYNVLFLSAFIILIYDSNQLFNVGFLLSYAALLGLMILQPRIERKIEFKNKLNRYAWSITTGLFSAWLFTLPLTLFFFNKVSFLGMLSNFLVIPIAQIILNLGFAFLILSPIPIEIIHKWIGNILNGLLWVQNEIILFFEQIPLSFFDKIFLTEIEFFLILCILFFFCYFLIQKNKQSIYIIGILIITFTLVNTFNSVKKREETHWIFFNLRKFTAFGYKKSQNLYLFTDSLDSKTYDFSVQPYINLYQIDSVYQYSLKSSFRNQKMLFGIDSIQKPEYFLCSKENKSIWKYNFNRTNNIIFAKNMGTYYQKKNKNKYNPIHVQSDTSKALMIKR